MPSSPSLPLPGGAGRPSTPPHTLPSGAIGSELEVRAQRLAGELARARQDLSTVEVDLRNARGERDSLRSELAQAKTRIAELEAALEKSHQAPAPGSDDLKRIKGIGPKFEKLLKAAGVTSIGTVAHWTDGDIDAIAERIGVKAERIRREDWVARARALSG